MSLLQIVLRSLRQHALSTAVTVVSIALAGGLLMAVWVVKSQAEETFTRVDGGFDGVFGARSSQLQLVLNAIYHLESSPGNLRPEQFDEIRNHPGVAHAIPLAVGDNYRGYRLVGTVTNLFAEIELAPGEGYELAAGRVFEAGYREALVGSFVAQRLGLRVGDHFHPFHGFDFDEHEEHDDEYVVTGILKPTNTPGDRVIWVPIEGIQHMSGHAAESANDISAVLVKLRNPASGFRLDQQYNREGRELTFAWPIGSIMTRLFGKIAWFDRVLALVANLIALVAVAGILTGIYNTMNERRRDFAILRALGAGRSTVFSTILLEAVVIAAIGAALAFVFYLGLMSAAATVIRAQTGVVLSPLAGHAVMLWAPLALIGAAAVAGLVPAWKAYRTDVAENLAPAS